MRARTKPGASAAAAATAARRQAVQQERLAVLQAVDPAAPLGPPPAASDCTYATAAGVCDIAVVGLAAPAAAADARARAARTSSFPKLRAADRRHCLACLSAAPAGAVLRGGMAMDAEARTLWSPAYLGRRAERLSHGARAEVLGRLAARDPSKQVSVVNLQLASCAYVTTSAARAPPATSPAPPPPGPSSSSTLPSAWCST
jgi:hypothetical protein